MRETIETFPTHTHNDYSTTSWILSSHQSPSSPRAYKKFEIWTGTHTQTHSPNVEMPIQHLCTLNHSKASERFPGLRGQEGRTLYWLSLIGEVIIWLGCRIVLWMLLGRCSLDSYDGPCRMKWRGSSSVVSGYNARTSVLMSWSYLAPP